MAIMGFLVHALKEDVGQVEQQLSAFSELTTYGIHQDQYVVVVAEVISDRIEKLFDQVKALDGVLSIYTTYLTIEDEMDENGNIETNLSPIKLFRKKSRLDTPD